MAFSPEAVKQGNVIKKQLEETPRNFATEGGAAFSKPTGDLAKQSQQRMAGPMGAFAMEAQNNPDLQIHLAKWGEMFNQSNQGSQFNQAKMQAAMAQAAQQVGGQA